MQDLGTFIWDLGISLWDLGTSLQDLGISMWDLGTSLWDLGTSVQDLGTSIRDLGTSVLQELPHTARAGAGEQLDLGSRFHRKPDWEFCLGSSLERCLLQPEEMFSVLFQSSWVFSPGFGLTTLPPSGQALGIAGMGGDEPCQGIKSVFLTDCGVIEAIPNPASCDAAPQGSNSAGFGVVFIPKTSRLFQRNI